MERFAFISRHEPAPGQIEMANRWGVDLVHVGDADAFEVTPEWVESFDNCLAPGQNSQGWGVHERQSGGAGRASAFRGEGAAYLRFEG